MGLEYYLPLLDRNSGISLRLRLPRRPLRADVTGSYLLTLFWKEPNLTCGLSNSIKPDEEEEEQQQPAKLAAAAAVARRECGLCKAGY